jgi:hypothetical protein
MRAVLLALVSTLLVGAPAYAAGGSGDVDGDGRLTVRDAVMIFETSQLPEMARLTTIRAACDFDGNGACTTDDAYAILMAIVSDFSDFDGDGVPNESDCHPLDERLSTPHTYFLDLDRDSFGDSNNRVEACALAPPVPAVAWGGDPDDASPFAIVDATPRGERLLGLDFLAPSETGQFREDLAREIGVDTIALRLTWDELETSGGAFNGPQVPVLAVADAEFPARGLRVSLTLSPASGARLTAPPDLKSAIEQGALRFSDAAVIDRFKAMLTFVRGQLPNAELSSLQIGYEVDEFLARAPLQFWADYGVFFAAVSAHAKALWGPQLRVGINATHAGILSESRGPLLRSLNGLTDMVSLTYLPRRTDGSAIDPLDVRVDVQRVIAMYFPKPLYFDAVGYPSAAVLGASLTRQSQFLRAFFEIWDTYPTLIPMASFTRLHDTSFDLARFIALGSGGDLLRDTAYHQSLGLRTWEEDGINKPAYQTLRNLAFERGWWKLAEPAVRSFDLGFTPALYDFPTTAPVFGEMLDWIQQTLASDATTVNLHLDHGVPWVEALADTFASEEIPYSPAVQSMWLSMRQRVPAGKKVLVSINPLGVPRNVIAPYFGVGEGFTYNDQFERVGDGIVADKENRLPPAPWNTYALNHPDVKQAFINYCRRAIQYFQPDQLVLAIEITATMNESPPAYDQLLDLLQAVNAALKSMPETAGVPLGVSISATTFMTDEYGVSHKHEDQPRLKRELQVQGLTDVLPFVDFLGLSLYPHYGKYNASTMPASMFDALMPLLEATGKPIVITETGWPAETYTVLGVPFFSTTDKQDRYYRLLFYEMTKTSAPVDSIISFAPRDSDRGWQRLLEGSQQDPPTVSPQFVEFYKYFRDIGLYDGEGGTRPATDTWKRWLALPHVPEF